MCGETGLFMEVISLDDDRRLRGVAYALVIMTAKIHPTSTINGEVHLADDVEIGPHCVLDGPITIGAGTVLMGHSYLTGPLTIGAGNRIYPFVCLGFEPQDYKFDPEANCAGVVIGDHNIIREHVTIHRSTSAEEPTTVGDECMLMVGSHIGHDCWVGNRCILVNNVALAGHVILEDQVLIGGASVIGQRTRIGRLTFIGGAIGVGMHVPPFVLVRRINLVSGLNLIGLRRAGMAREEIDRLQSAFHIAFDDRNGRAAVMEQLLTISDGSPVVREFYEFFRGVTGSICRREPPIAKV